MMLGLMRLGRRGSSSGSLGRKEERKDGWKDWTAATQCYDPCFNLGYRHYLFVNRRRPH